MDDCAYRGQPNANGLFLCFKVREMSGVDLYCNCQTCGGKAHVVNNAAANVLARRIANGRLKTTCGMTAITLGDAVKALAALDPVMAADALNDAVANGHVTEQTAVDVAEALRAELSAGVARPQEDAQNNRPAPPSAPRMVLSFTSSVAKPVGRVAMGECTPCREKLLAAGKAMIGR